MSKPRTPSAPTNAATVDQTMRALADGRRRATLSYLFERDGEDAASVAELAAEVAADAANGDAIDRTYQSLHHAHLPHLDDAGIVAYEPDDKRVRLAGDQSAVEELLAVSSAPR